MAVNDIIAGLDLGTTKVCTVVGEETEEGIDIIGIGSVPAKGLRKGVVINIDSTVQAIQAALAQAEKMAGVEINTVFVGVSGSHIRGSNQEGVAAISAREVSAEDVKRALEQAKAVPLPSECDVIHVLPQEYVVDKQDGIREPIGMAGVRLEARVHMVTAALSSVQNIRKCAERCDLDVAEVVLEPLASAEAVLSEDEKEIGVMLVDVGGGTTDIIIYADGAVVHTSVIPMGGMNVTNDIATGMRTPVAEAERIKIKYGCALSSMVDPEDLIEVPSVGGRPPRSELRVNLCDIIEPRAEEIFAAVAHVLEQTGFRPHLASGVVITGGTTQLEGMPELAEEILELPVRRAVPMGVGGLHDTVKSPAYATGVGLVRYGARRLDVIEPAEQIEEPEQETKLGLGQRIGAWFKEVF